MDSRTPGKRKQLLSGIWLQACCPDRKNSRIKIVCCFGPQGSFKFGLKFAKEDMRTIIDILEEAARSGEEQDDGQ